MRAEHSLTAPKEEYVYKVIQWKWEPDKSAPWWQRKFFHWVYLPFQNFSLNWFKVPPMKEVVIEADEQGRVRHTFSWFEDEGIYDDQDRADRACLTEHYGYRKTLKNRLHPSESTQTFGTVFPRKKDRHKWGKPTLSLIAKDRQKEEREQKLLAQYIQEISKALD